MDVRVKWLLFLEFRDGGMCVYDASPSGIVEEDL
jgi:hypothetical protein